MISKNFTLRLASFAFILAFVSASAFATTTDPSTDKKEDATTEPGAMFASGVTSFTLINANTDQPISGYNPISNGAVINLATLPTTNLNIRANVGTDVTVKSVQMSLDGSSGGSDANRTENAAPYAMFGDDSGDYRVWSPAPKAGYKYSLTASAYTGSKATGTKINTKTISFSFIDQEPSTEGVVSFTLINANNNSPISGYNPIANNAQIDISKLPTTNLNIRANTNPSKVGSVVFSLDGSSGGSDFSRTESAAPYALFGDDNGNYRTWKPSAPKAGYKYTLVGTAYSGSKGTGTKLEAKTISFSFVSGTTTQPKDCAGVEGGSAFIDDCGVCVGGTTGKDPCDTTPPPPPPSGGGDAGCGDFIESGGLVAIEIEAVPKANSNWYKGNGPVNGLPVPSPRGSYYMWKANCSSNCEKVDQFSSSNAMTYKVYISNPGRYRVKARTWQPNISYPGEAPWTANNDFWIRFPDTGGKIIKNGSVITSFGPGTPEKVFQSNVNGWRWETKMESSAGSAQLFVDFPSKGTYRIEIAGRSKLFAIDRFVLFKSNVSASTAHSAPQSARKTCNTINDEDLLAIEAENEIGIYPNPFSNTFNLNVNSSVQSIRIFDLSGKVVYENNSVDTRTGQLEINLGTRPSGVYQVLMTTENGPKMIRVLKQ